MSNEQQDKNEPVESEENIFLWKLGALLGSLFLLFIFFEINHQGKPQIVYGKIISNGVISIKPDYATSNSNQPMILVVCDDKILVKVELDRETLAAGYKIEKNERVKVRRFQRGPSSSDTYEGKLIPL